MSVAEPGDLHGGPAGVGTDQMTGFADAVVTTIRDALVVIADDSSIRAVNHAFGAAFGADERQVVGRTLSAVGPGPWNGDDVRTAIADVIAGAAELRDVEATCVLPERGQTTWRVRVRRLSDPSSGRPHLLLVVEDVTDERAASAAAEAYRLELERSNRDLQQFAYAASHDLQEPLRTIASFGSLIDRRYRAELPEGAIEPLDFMVDAATRMQALVQDLLSFSRVGTRELRLELVPLGAVVDQVVAQLGDALERSGAQVRYDARELPTVRADRSLLGPLLQNLLMNAVTYGSRPGEPVNVDVVAEAATRGRVTVRVTDDGPGVPAQHRERVFGLFERLHSTRHSAGSGIGLSLCRRIVERHGGRIRVEDAPSSGASFVFDLPGAAA